MKYIISLVVAGVLLFFSFRSVNWKDFGECLRACRWEFVAATALSVVLVHLVRAARAMMLLRKVDPAIPFYASFHSVNVGMLLNIVVSRVGELLRCTYVTRRSARDANGRRLATLEKVFGTVLLERSWDVLFGTLTTLVAIIAMWSRFGDFFSEHILRPLRSSLSSWWVAALAIVALTVVIALVRSYREKNCILQKADTILTGIGEGLKTCLYMKRGWMFIVYTVLIWGLYWAESYLIIEAMKGIRPEALGADMQEPLRALQALGPLDALFLMLCGSASALVPVPGGFGAYHGIVAGALLSVFGIPFGLGIIYATLTHETTVIAQALCGLGSLAHDTLKKE